ncbi:MAG: CBS domain-containing protein [Burkholderiales bacterium]|nr:CBS domain-containing protein [Burkholderiales bacterium]
MSERTVIQSISSKRVLTTSPQANAYEAACVMTDARCGSIVVTDPSGSMVGILTERDLMTKVVARGLDPSKASVSEIMTKNPRYVSPETSVSNAVLIMKEGGFRHLPIVSAHSRKVIGMFSIRDASPRELSEADRRAEYLELMSDSVAY